MFDLIELILPILLMIFGILAVLLSKSNLNYKKLVKSWGNEFAEKTTKAMNAGGYLLLVASGIWLAATLLLK